jgi:hypothetical protein
MPIPLGVLAVAGAGAAGGGPAYDLLETTTVNGSSSLSFSSLDTYSNYKHLQIRVVARADAGGERNLGIRFNSDSGNNYNHHRLQGNGSSVASNATTSTSSILTQEWVVGAESGVANAFGVAVIDILDFSSSSKNTTVRVLSGAEASVDRIVLTSGAWRNTAAVTSIDLFTVAANFSNSRFSLYGIK